MIPRAHPFRLGLLLALAVATFAVFTRWPELDLWVTGAFFDPARHFAAADEGALNTLRLAVWRLSEAMLGMSLTALIVGLWTGADVLGLPRRVWLWITLLYLLAPGLIVDALLKPIWGRARPADVTGFGGTLAFTPPQQPFGQCLQNCSFVSGEVAGAVALALSIALLLRHHRGHLSRAWGSAVLALCLAIPLFTAFQRIAAGRHFLSDAMLAVILVLLVATLLDRLIFPPRKPPLKRA